MTDYNTTESTNNQVSNDWLTYGKLFAIGLPSDCKESHIRKHFEQFGQIRRIEISSQM